MDRKELGAAQIAAEESGEGLPAAVGNLVSERAQASAFGNEGPSMGRAKAEGQPQPAGKAKPAEKPKLGLQAL